MAGYIDDIDTTSPLVTDDPGDFPAEMRNFKARVKDSFPNVSGAVAASDTDLNTVDVTTLGTVEASKVVTADSNKDVTALRNVTATGTVTGGTVTDGTAAITGGVVTGATLTSPVLTSATLTSPVLNTGVSGTAVKDEDDLASDSATHVATQQSIKAYVDTAVSGLSSGKLLDFAFEITASNVNCTTGWQTRDTVTLTNVQSGSTVLLFAVGQYDHPVAGDASGHLDITDSSNNGLLAGGEFAAAHMPNTGSNSYVVITAIGRDSSPSVGANTYNFRYKATSTNVDLLNSTLVALEIAP